ncbi:TPA: hypothetical protein ACPOKW_001831, partial [Haemophilus influenzae]
AQTSGRSRATEIIQRLRTHYPLKWLLGFAQLARSTFFAKLQIKLDKDEPLKKAIKRIKANHPDYGYRRVHAYLPGVNHIVESWLNMASFKVCREKGIAWTMQRWKVSLGD